MSKESDHGKKHTSTANLFNKLMNEEALPDYLLSPDSIVRKKRNAHQFINEINFISLIEAIRIYKEMLHLLRNVTEEYTNKINHSDRDFNEYWDKVAANTYVPQKANNDLDIANAKDQYDKFITLIDTKIKFVRELVVLQKQRLDDLKTQTISMKKDLLNEWNKYLVAEFEVDPDFVGIKLAINVNGKEQFVDIYKPTYVKLLRDIATVLQQDSVSITSLSDVILQKATEVVRQKSQLTVDLQQQAIIQLSDQVWHDISNNSDLKNKIHKMCEAEHAIAEAGTKLALCEQALNGLLNIREVAEKQLSEIDALLNLDHLNSQMSHLDNLLNDNLSVVERLHLDSSSLLGELAEIQKEAKEVSGDEHEQDQASLFKELSTLHEKANEIFDTHRGDELIDLANEDYEKPHTLKI